MITFDVASLLLMFGSLLLSFVMVVITLLTYAKK